MTKDTYVELIEPITTRKSLLNQAISIIKLQESRERLNELQKEKREKTIELKQKLSEIPPLLNELKLLIPESKIPKEARRKEKIKPTKKRTKKELIIEEPRLSSVEKEIEEIRERLASLKG